MYSFIYKDFYGRVEIVEDVIPKRVKNPSVGKMIL
jgi:hypothetical protein